MIASSHKGLSRASPSTGKKRRTIPASKLPAGSPAQIDLVQCRISYGLCLECGGARPGDGGDFCAHCLSAYPKQTNIGTPIDAWQYFVVQTKPAIPGLMAFTIWRAPVYERKGNPECITWTDSFEEAKALAEKKRDRAHVW